MRFEPLKSEGKTGTVNESARGSDSIWKLTSTPLEKSSLISNFAAVMLFSCLKNGMVGKHTSDMKKITHARK
nr:hypothetical protein BaRGS_030696 [Batillaria attramentaria]